MSVCIYMYIYICVYIYELAVPSNLSSGVVLIMSVVVLSVMACLFLTVSLFGAFCYVVGKNRKRFRELSRELDNNVRQQILSLTT